MEADQHGYLHISLDYIDPLAVGQEGAPYEYLHPDQHREQPRCCYKHRAIDGYPWLYESGFSDDFSRWMECLGSLTGSAVLN